MNRTGRLTLPASIRKKLRLEGEAEFEVQPSEDGEAVVLRPVVTIPRSDAWVYTKEDLESIERGLRDLREGRERTATEADFRALAEVAED
jgi:bifunctional DNA-binding transcriptional regulator/antitoxin component of YhaV-PrlF toxin-antitoxin module